MFRLSVESCALDAISTSSRVLFTRPGRPISGCCKSIVDLVLYLFVLVGRDEGVVASDVVELGEAIAAGLGQPFDDQARVLPGPFGAAAPLRHAAQR